MELASKLLFFFLTRSMAEDILLDEDSVVSIKDVVEEEQELQETANAVLGDSDDTNCTYAKVLALDKLQSEA